MANNAKQQAKSGNDLHCSGPLSKDFVTCDRTVSINEVAQESDKNKKLPVNLTFNA